MNEILGENKDFKDSAVGKIPKDWDFVTIDDIATYVGSGITPKGGSNIYTKEGIVFIRSQNVTFEGLLLEDVAYIDEKIHKIMKRSEVFPHDVLINITGASIGRCCPLPEGLGKANVNQHVCAIRLPNPNFEDALFLSSVLASYIGESQINKLNAGGNREGLNYQQLRSFLIPLPQTKERANIAKIIDTLEKAIALTQTHINKLKLAKAGLLHDLLTKGIDEHGELRNPKRNPEQFKDSSLGKIPKDWEVCVVGDVIDPNRPIVYGILMPGYGYSGGIPVIKVKDIVNGEIKTDELLLTSPTIHKQYFRSRLKAGDLLFTIRGTVGRTAFVSNSLEGANITQDTARLAIIKAHPYFVRQYLEMPQCKAFIDLHTLGQAVQGINLRDVRVIPIAIPSLQEQLRIVRILEKQNFQVRTKEDYIEKLKLLKLGLMSDLLTGKVRVKI